MTEESFPALVAEFEHAARKLEFDSVLGLIAGFLKSERAAQRLFSINRHYDTDEVEMSQGEISELIAVREGGEDLPLSGWFDSFSLIERINAAGMVAASEEIYRIAAGEKTARDACRFLTKRPELMPLLSRHLDEFTIHEELVRRVSGAIGSDFEILDSASRELARIRKQSNALRDRLRGQFSRFASRMGSGKGYEFVTVRGERYVVSLPRSEAARIKGIVHQESASGASLYVEPLEFVEENNRLESYHEEERREVERILAELTALIFERREELLANQDTLLLLDCVAAKASFAARFNCIRPAHSSDGTLVLKDARHPLLERKLAEQQQRIEPLNIRCEPDLKALVISGPNAGGKTVTIKTSGLFIMMDRAGFLVPCRDGTVIPDYDKVFVDIGDDQSIEKSLSTFSSRIVRMKKILGLVDGKSLVLVDEIGDGTDPEEGAALAEAILDRLTAAGGRTIVTTHLRSLKGWAHERAGARNATLAFDPDRLEPLYELRMGVPGRSWGIEMAGRFGLDADLVEKARSGMGKSALRLEELLAHLEKTERIVNDKRDELVEKEDLLSSLIERYQGKMDRFSRNRDEMVETARKEALDIVSSTRREMENLIREIRSTQAERRAIREAHERIKSSKEDIEEKLEAEKPRARVRPEDLRPGVYAEITSIGKIGKVLSIDSDSRVFLELEGGLRVETKVEDLAPAENAGKKRSSGGVTWSTPSYEPVLGELMVRGLERQEALEKTDAFIDRAVLQELRTVTIIHGVGKGILKRAIYDMLKKDPRVESVRPGEPARGGDGVVVVTLK